MDCRHAQSQFTDLLEGTLPPEQWRELEAHLAQCPVCAEEVRRFRQTVSALRGLELITPPAGLAIELRRRLAPEPVHVGVAASGPGPVVRRRWRLSWQASSALAAACLLIALASLHVLRPGLGGPAGLPESALRFPVEAPVASESAALAEPQIAAETSEAVDAAPAAPGAAMTESRPPRLARSGRTPSTDQVASAPAPPAPAAPPAAPAEAPRAASPEEILRAGAAATLMAPSADYEAAPAAAGATKGAPVGPQERVAFGAGMPGMPAPAAPAAVGVAVRVDPPAERIVGQWGTLRVLITPEADVPQVSVQVSGEGALEVRGGAPAYQGPLAGREVKRVSVQVRSREPGEQRLRVALSSATPGLSTTVRVVIPGYRTPPQAEAGQTRAVLRSAPLAEAAARVARDCGLRVTVASELAGQRVSADFSGGVTGPRALAILAQMAGGRLEQAQGAYRLVPAAAPDPAE